MKWRKVKPKPWSVLLMVMRRGPPRDVLILYRIPAGGPRAQCDRNGDEEALVQGKLLRPHFAEKFVIHVLQHTKISYLH